MLRSGASLNAPTPFRVPWIEHLTNFLLVLFGIIGYQELACQACLGRPHTLPPDSTLLAGYPCGSNIPQGLFYLMRNAHLVYWDLLRVNERFLALACSLLVLRPLASLILPARVYCQLAAPLLAYSFRSYVVAFNILMGPNHEPSAFALERMFRSLTAVDLGGFLTMQLVTRVNLALELAHCAAMAAGLLVLCRWHGHRVPGGVNIAWQLATRSMVPCVTLYLNEPAITWPWRRWRRRSVGTQPGVGAGGLGLVPGMAGKKEVLYDADVLDALDSKSMREAAGKVVAGPSASGGGRAAVGSGAGHGDGGSNISNYAGSTTLGLPRLRERRSCEDVPVEVPQKTFSPQGQRQGHQLQPQHQQYEELQLSPLQLPQQRSPGTPGRPGRSPVCAGGAGLARSARNAEATTRIAAAAATDGAGAEAGHVASGGTVAPVTAAAAPDDAVGMAPAVATPDADAAATVTTDATASYPTVRGAMCLATAMDDANAGALPGSFDEVISTARHARMSQPRPQRSEPLPPYQPFVRQRIHRYKIPWAEPEQLSPGYEQRLRDLAASRGYHLAAVYVRRGCVELTMVLEEQLDTDAGAVQPPAVHLDVETVVGAVGLLPRLTAAAAEAEAQREAETQPGVTARGSCDLGAAAGEARADAGDSDGAPALRGGFAKGEEELLSSIELLLRDGGPRVLSAWPLVVRARQRRSCEGAVAAVAALAEADGGEGERGGRGGAAAAASGKPLEWQEAAMELRVVVDWREGSGPTRGSSGNQAGPEAAAQAGGGPNEMRLQVLECGGRSLPASIVARGAVPAGDAEGTTSYKYDIELIKLPERPGYLWVELQEVPQPHSLCGAGSSSGDDAAAGRQSGCVVLRLLIVNDADVAAELTAVAAAPNLRESAAAELDGLLYDMGSWSAAVATAGPTAAASNRLGPLHAALGPHLLRFVRAAGWEATAEWIAGHMRRCGLDAAEAADDRSPGGSVDTGGCKFSLGRRVPAPAAPHVVPPTRGSSRYEFTRALTATSPKALLAAEYGVPGSGCGAGSGSGCVDTSNSGGGGTCSSDGIISGGSDGACRRTGARGGVRPTRRRAGPMRLLVMETSAPAETAVPLQAL